MHTGKKKKLLIVLLIVLTVIVGVAAVTPLVISTRYERTIEQNLPRWVAQATDSLYRISVDDISISTFTKNITLSGIHLQLDSNRFEMLRQRRQLPATLFAADIERIELEKIRWADLLADKAFSCKKLSILRPSLVIDESDTSFTKPDVLTRRDLKISTFSIGQVRLQSADLNFRNYNRADSLSFVLKGGTIALNDWKFDALLPDDTSLFFYAKEGTIDLDSAVLQKSNSLYAFKTGRIKFVSQNDNLVFENMAIQPAMTREEYYRRIGFKDEIFTVVFPKLTLNGFNWRELSKGSLTVRSVVLEKPVADIFLNRLLPPEPKPVRKFPNQMLLAAAFPIAIDTLYIKNGQLKYTELSDKSKLEGTLPLTGLNLTMVNATNLPHRIVQDGACRISLQARLFGSPVTGKIELSLRDTLGSFSAKINGGAMDGRKLNPLTQPVALMEIESLSLKKADVLMKFNGRSATGNCLFLYDDLDLKILEVRDDKTFNGKGLISFVLNKALLYPANPLPGMPERRIVTSMVRNPDQSFFNLLWGMIRKCVLLTAGRNDRIADMVTAKK